MSAYRSLAVRTGDGSPAVLPPALVLYAWGAKGISAALRDGFDELRAVRPDALAIHGTTADLSANLVKSVADFARRSIAARYAVPRLWVGVGIDGTVSAWRRGQLATSQVLERHRAVARAVAKITAEAVIANGEAAWARDSQTTRTRDEIRDLAQRIARVYREECPRAVLGLSTFGRLGAHADVRPMIEGFSSSCSLLTGQSYAAEPGPVVPGRLPTRLAADERSQLATVREGWMRADLSAADGADVDPDDLDRLPTIQAHKVYKIDTARVASERSHVALWSVPLVAEGGRADDDGIEAAIVARVIRAAGGVREFQRRATLKPDGVLGPKTFAAALARSIEDDKPPFTGMP